MDPTPSPDDHAVTTGPRRGRSAFWVVLVVTLVLDQMAKYLVFAADPAYGIRPVDPGQARPWSDHAVTIFCQLNRGAAFSLGDGSPWLILGITVVLVPVLFAVYWRGFRPRGRPLEHLCFGAILGGALGNAWDRVVAATGMDPVIAGVRDFIHVDLGFWPCNPWPTFNLADAGLTGAVTILLVLGLLPGRGATHATNGDR